MAQLVFVVAGSGMGKSTSLRNLNPDETIIGNSDQKALPFRKFSEMYNVEKGNYYKTSNVPEIITMLKKAHTNPKIKRAIVDTWSRTMTDGVMSESFRNEKGFDKWTRFAAQHYDLINIINEKMRDDIIVYLFAHPETHYDDFGTASQKIAVQGKSLERFVPESFSSIVLYCEVLKTPGEPNRHVFRTKTNGNDTCKTPIDMFEEEYIENDLVIVDHAIRDYFGI